MDRRWRLLGNGRQPMPWIQLSSCCHCPTYIVSHQPSMPPRSGTLARSGAYPSLLSGREELRASEVSCTGRVVASRARDYLLACQLCIAGGGRPGPNLIVNLGGLAFLRPGDHSPWFPGL